MGASKSKAFPIGFEEANGRSKFRTVYIMMDKCGFNDEFCSS